MSGYCTHSSVLFPIWHRPYLALIEVSLACLTTTRDDANMKQQEVYRLAGFIAGMFPNSTERQLYQQAASTFRLPYWDWALPAPPNETHFPQVFWGPTLKQYGPRGFQTIRNPLYSYRFNPVDEEAFIWSPVRFPDSSL